MNKNMENSRPDIAMFLPTLSGGGAERVMVALANSFSQRGLKVDLVLVKAEGQFLSDVNNNIRIINLQRTRVRSSLLPLSRYLKLEKPLSMLSAMHHVNIIALLALKLSRVNTRLVLSEHISLSAHSAGPNENKLIMILMRFLYPLADKIIAVSQEMARELVFKLGLKGDKVKSIPNPVNIEMIHERANEKLTHDWLSNGQQPLLVAVGRLEAQKDYLTLIEAFAKLRSKKNVRLVILGEGRQREILEQKIRECQVSDVIELPGFSENPYAWMKSCDLFVMSSLMEGFPVVMVEAMACGARIVSTNCPTGPAEILENGRWGRLVPVSDANALANAMLEALEDLGSPNVRKRAEQFQTEKITDQYLSILRD